MPNRATEITTIKPVRISYPHLLTPRKNDDGTPGKYGAMLLIPKENTADIKAINDAVEAARKEGVANGIRNAKSFQSPLRDGDGQKPRGGNYGDECKGCYVLNTSSKRQPILVNQKRQPIVDPNEIYPGIWANVAINFACFSMQANSGISCYLNGVQKVRDDEPLGGYVARAEDMFTVMEGEDDDLGL